MRERLVWDLTLAVALVTSWAGPTPCAAQPSAVPASTPPTESTAPAPLRPRVPLTPPRPFQVPGETTAPMPAPPRPAVPPPRRSGPTPSISAGATALAPPRGDLSLRLQPAPLEPTDWRFPI